MKNAAAIGDAWRRPLTRAQRQIRPDDDGRGGGENAVNNSHPAKVLPCSDALPLLRFHPLLTR